VSKEYLTYEQGWQDAFDALAKYIEAEVCPVTGQMIRRMKDEGWRYPVKAVSGDAEKAQGEQEAEIAGEQG
jgi:hypothetical protein